MGKLRNNEKGFGAVEGLLIVAVVVLLGVVGYMVYKNHNKTTTPTTASTTTSTKTTTTPAKTTATPTTVDPYAGWKTASTVGNVSVKYPSSWTVKDNSSSNNNRAALTITSPDGSIFAVQNGIVQPGGLVVATSSPVTFNKQSEYLLYGTDGTSSTANSFNQFELSSSSTAFNPINAAGGSTAWMVTFYSPNFVTASTLNNNSEFQDAKLMVQSIQY